jgi:ABC-type antimicrobial peptide transport system permease subunit
MLRLVLGFAGVALALAAIGVYVVIAFGIAQRTREIGIRMAVGATSRDVIGLVLRQSLVLAGVGAVAGIAGGIAIARVLRATVDSVLYRTSPFAVLPLAISAGVLGAIALAAAWMPARRAAAVDPVTALRSE